MLSRRIGINVRVHTLDSLRYRDFRLMWALNFFFAGFDWLFSVVMGWMTFDLTRSPLLTSLALAMSAVPFLLAGPLAGVLVDAWDRRKLLALGIGSKAVISAAFAVIVVLGLLETWHIFVFLLLIGVSYVLIHTAMMSMLPNIVPKESLVNAYALTSIAFNMTRLVVPAAAGLSITLLGAGQTLLLGVAMLLAGMMAALAIKIKGTEDGEMRPKPSIGQLAEVARYVKGQNLLLVLLLLSALPAVLVLPFAYGLMPVYASQVFSVGPVGLGILMSAPGVGSIVGTIAVASLGDIRYKGRVIVLCLALMIVAMIAFSRIGSMVPSLVILMLLSGSLATFFTVNGATIQSIVPDRLRGRVAALGSLALGAYPLGALAAGGLAELLGAPASTFIGGAAMAFVLVAISPILRRVWGFSK